VTLQTELPVSGASAAPDLGTGPIPTGPYYHPEYFELEREAVFRRTWLQIGHVCELPQPNSYIVRELEVANTSVLITRGKDDVIRAFHNVCTHRGTQLVLDQGGKRPSFSCQYHGWNFTPDGKLRSAPDFGRFYVDKSQCGLPTIAVEVCAGLIFVNLDPEPALSLREFLGPMAEKLETLPVAQATTFTEYVYEIEANWKLTFDNFQENYHLRFIHSRSGRGGATGPDNPFGYPTDFGFAGPHRYQTVWTNPDFAPSEVQGIALMKQLEGALARQLNFNMEYLALFPNFFIFGMAIQHFSHTVMPISPTRSRGVVRLYWVGDDQNASERFAREYAACTTLDIHSEDRTVIEAGQRGISSGALDVIHFQEQEILLRHLYHMVDAAVTAYQDRRTVAAPAVVQ
jgi:phenylpropionate dioxygenase-like ring-hydroxylating dioxygenase large terminal subunit